MSDKIELIFRKVEALCPKCKQKGLEAIEIIKNNVVGYRCTKCGAEYDTVVFHDWNKRKHYWLGKLRNPEFWKLDNKTIEEGIIEMQEREKKGIKEYLGIYMIEEIKLNN